MNGRDCPACAERYPLQHGLHSLPDGDAMPCSAQPRLSRRPTVKERRMEILKRAARLGLRIVREAS